MKKPAKTHVNLARAAAMLLDRLNDDVDADHYCERLNQLLVDLLETGHLVEELGILYANETLLLWYPAGTCPSARSSDIVKEDDMPTVWPWLEPNEIGNHFLDVESIEALLVRNVTRRACIRIAAMLRDVINEDRDGARALKMLRCGVTPQSPWRYLVANAWNNLGERLGYTEWCERVCW